MLQTTTKKFTDDLTKYEIVMSSSNDGKDMELKDARSSLLPLGHSLPKLGDDLLILDRSIELECKKDVYEHGAIIGAQVWVLVGWRYRPSMFENHAITSDFDIWHAGSAFVGCA